MIICLVTFMLVVTCNNAAIKKVSSIEKTSQYWLMDGADNIRKRLEQSDNIATAKNIILFIGDGMGPSTITAARDFKNQRMANDKLPDVGIFFEQFPNIALAKTHSVDDYVADSSSTATAIVSGVKTNTGVTGVSPDVIFNNCASHNSSKYNLENIATMLRAKGKSVGVVTTTRITHATPSALYAHSASRDWESSVPLDCDKTDIAFQLIEKSEVFNVILGGGLGNFISESDGGYRKDNLNLINKWKVKMKKFLHSFVSNLTEFQNVDPTNTDYLFGLFSLNHLDYDAVRTNQPSLEEMTDTAIKILSKNPNGFFLMVEGGRIDHAHHQSKAKLALYDTLAFEKAIEKAYWSTDVKETFIAVTADHSHVFTLGSYAKRENDITKKNKAMSGMERDGKGHTSLLYSNGPGYKIPRQDITDETAFTIDFVYNSGVPVPEESHGGEDIAVYSQGPWAHLLNGVHHQSYIGHVMMYASCTGPYRTRPNCSSVILNQPSILLVALLLMVSKLIAIINL